MLVMVGNGVVAGANHIGQLSKDEATRMLLTRCVPALTTRRYNASTKSAACGEEPEVTLITEVRGSSMIPVMLSSGF